MAPPKMKLREKAASAEDSEPEGLSQRKRPELHRYLLQVDRQTKASYPTVEAAEAAGMVIKTGHPIVQVSVYDSVDCVGKVLTVPAA